MWLGLFNVLVGAVMIVGGLTGHLNLLGTSSGYALAGVGAIITLVGLHLVREALAQR